MSDYGGYNKFKKQYSSGGGPQGYQKRYGNDNGYQGGNRSTGDGYQGGYNKGGYNKGNFGNKPVETDPYIPVAFMANPEAPLDIIDKFKALTKEMSSLGFTIRAAGGNSEADDAIVKETDKLEVYLPWKGFNNIEESFSYFADESSIVQACKYHPAADRMKDGAKKFLSRNYRLLQGKNLKSAAKFVVIWSEDGASKLSEKTFKTGPVGHVLSIAASIKTPVFNLGKRGVFEELMEYLKVEKENEYRKEDNRPSGNSNYSNDNRERTRENRDERYEEDERSDNRDNNFDDYDY